MQPNFAMNQYMPVQLTPNARAVPARKKTAGFLSLLLLALGTITIQAQTPTAFTYQGRLTDASGPANGAFDVRFTIHDAATAGSVVSPALTNSALSVSNGLFAVSLDFGIGVFNGSPRWLEIAVRTNGAASFTPLAPRQALTAAPYALFAPNAGTAATAQSVASGSQTLELKVNNQRVLKFEPGDSAPNLIGGYYGNTVSSGVRGATIAGGGGLNTYGLTQPQRVSDHFGAIGGGDYNRIETNAPYATIAGGFDNVVQGGAQFGNIAGGTGNRLAGAHGGIGGGANNTIQTNADSAHIGGGYDNLIGSNALWSVISGGLFNSINPNAEGATIPGGQFNLAGGSLSLAAGYRAQSLHNGSFVWADSTDADFASTAANQFILRAAGGMGIGTNNPAGAMLNVAGPVRATSFQGSGAALTGVNAVTLGGLSPSAFGTNLYLLIVKTAGDGAGTVTSSPGSISCGAVCVGAFPPGTVVNLTALLGADSTFQGWSGAASGSGTNTSVTMDASKSVTATFARRNFTLSVTRTGGGAVISDLAGINCGPVCSTSLGYGTVVQLAAIADPGFTFAGWTGDASGNGTANLTMNAARSVTATFTGTAIYTGNFIGNGAALTNVTVQASNLFGVLADSRLSSNIARLNTNQTFTSSNSFTGVVTANNASNQLAGAFTGSFTGNGSGVTNLPSSSLTGTIADARLSANVALLNSAPGFSGAVTAPGFTGSGANLTSLNGSQITSGTVAEPRIDSTLARDNEVFSLVLASDGALSGLDADLLDGQHASAFAAAFHNHDGAHITTGTVGDDHLSGNVARLNTNQTFTTSNTFTGVVTATNASNQFSGSFAGSGGSLTGLNGSQITWGTVAEPRIDTTLTRDTEVFSIVLASDGSFSGLDADLLDGQHASAFAATNHVHASLFAGTGVTGTYYNGSTATSFGVAYGTSAGTAVQGNVIATITAGAGLTGGVTADALGDGFTATLDVVGGNGIVASANDLSLGPLTGNWNQTGGFDIVLVDSASELSIKESVGDTYYGTLDVGDLMANATYTFVGLSGSVWTSGNHGSASGLDADLLDGQHASAFAPASHNHDGTNITTGTIGDARLSANIARLNTNQTFTASNVFTGVVNATNANNQITGSFSGTGANLTSLNGSQITSGTVADARLSGNVALLNTSQTHTGTPLFNPPSGPPFLAGNSNVVANLNASLLSGAPLSALVRKDLSQTSTQSMLGTLIVGNVSPHAGYLNQGWQGVAAHVFSSSYYYGPDAVSTIYIGQSNPVNIGGTLTAASFTGSGSGLSSIPAGNLTGNVAEPRVDSALARDSEVFSLVLASDGPGSGLDADLLDGQHASAFAPASGSSAYIQAQTAAAQAAGFWISGNATASSFIGSGANLSSLNANSLSSGTVSDVRLSGNVSLLNANQTVTGTRTFNAAVTLSGTVQAQSSIYMNDRDIQFRADGLHGLGWYGNPKFFGGVNVNGPVLYGNGGGALGVNTGSLTNIALSWDASRSVNIAGTLSLSANAYLNDKDLLLRNDANHGLGWYGAGKTYAGLAVNGPVLYGYNGGGLGTVTPGTSTNLALFWNIAGQIGIGTTSPTHQLHIHSASTNTLHLTGTGANYSGAKLNFGDAEYVYLHEVTDDILRIQATRAGVGRTPAVNRFEVEGEASKTTAGSWAANSDARIKTDITSVTNALDTLGKVHLVSFRYTDDYRAQHPSIEDRPYLNVVAQEFREVFPEAVKSSGEKLPGAADDILQVDTYPLTIYSAAAVQELNRKLETQLRQKDAEIQSLKKSMEELKQAVDRLARSTR